MYVLLTSAITDSDNGKEPVWHQAITWINADISPTGTWGTKFIEILFEN